jgi:orotate phosphoribosyltransferase
MSFEIPKALLESQAVHIKTKAEDYFTWTSGKKSPIYCDNRQLISYPEFREQITQKFCEIIKAEYPTTQLIAGTATAGIPWAAWIAQALNLPMIYIRSKPKSHGLKSAIEGHISENQNTIIIEDLISTGKSSLEACEHARADKLNVLSVMSIFTYNFNEALEKFSSHKIATHSLCDVESLLEFAKAQNLLNEQDCQNVLSWKNSF